MSIALCVFLVIACVDLTSYDRCLTEGNVSVIFLHTRLTALFQDYPSERVPER